MATAVVAQKLVKTISGDKTKTQIYCDIGKLGSQIEDAERKQDMNKIDELNKKMDEMATKLGPEYAALMTRLEDMDPNSKEALEIGSAWSLLRLLSRGGVARSCVPGSDAGWRRDILSDCGTHHCRRQNEEKFSHVLSPHCHPIYFLPINAW